MSFNKTISFVSSRILVLALLVLIGCKSAMPEELPNILWIVSEDNSPFLGCYGDELAQTPNLDGLASEGFLYTHAYANAPVCAPARNTIITGVYASSNGNQHMRSKYALSEIVRMYPEYLKELGYYCTNNSKTDYNTNSQPEDLWDESSKEAHYSNRGENQPFFHIKNIGTSHESSIFKSIPTDKLIHRPEDMKLPPYHPDTEDMRHDWAQYYDKITAMDTQVGDILQQLEEDGLASTTIVFYYGDHGGVLGRSKRFVYESGTHVPFIVRIPEKYKYLYPAKQPGSEVNRIVSFVDLCPTLLSITGTTLPDYLQGNAFLGLQKTEDPEYAFMFRGRMDERYDMCRAVRDDTYRYIKNYNPHRIYAQRIMYLWRAPSLQSWETAYLAGECNEVQSIFWNSKAHEELYDTENDPWEVNNLASDPEYKDILDRMRKANKEWLLRISDAGFIPESDLVRRTEGSNAYDYMRSGNVPLKELIDAAEIASLGDPNNLGLLTEYLKNKDSAMRYWGATGLLILGERAAPSKAELMEVLDDESPNVIASAAEALLILGETELAIKALLGVLKYPEDKAICHGMNIVSQYNLDDQRMKEAIVYLSTQSQFNYSQRIAEYLIEKWELKI